jgi:hypothetical protein
MDPSLNLFRDLGEARSSIYRIVDCGTNASVFYAKSDRCSYKSIPFLKVLDEHAYGPED